MPDFSGGVPERAAIERRDAQLVALADAAVIVWERCADIMRLLELIKAKGIPVQIIGGRKAPTKAKRVVEKDNPPDAPCLPMG